MRSHTRRRDAGDALELALAVMNLIIAAGLLIYYWLNDNRVGLLSAVCFLFIGLTTMLLMTNYPP